MARMGEDALRVVTVNSNGLRKRRPSGGALGVSVCSDRESSAPRGSENHKDSRICCGLEFLYTGKEEKDRRRGGDPSPYEANG